ncbi:carboxypeptidase-like regulatory domain-containing protein [Paradesertivirga mongoliensis]|uniref:Carboxypeptidase-like regulatory domain-containing protein n=1 Tax=Paradesertivirga mongoliensis TaxID=2100740 RepID=A0ABW4ZHD1_9SPHI|nr:TonB-dependent receptor [Pedobacter mongoliensis]
MYSYISIFRFPVFKSIFIFLLVCSAHAVFSQDQYLLEGYLYDGRSQAPVSNASLSINGSTKLLSNDQGYFSVKLSAGKHTLQFSHLAYDTLYQELSVNANQQVRFALFKKSSLMAEVTISAKGKSVKTIAPDGQTLTRTDIEKIPAFLGQRDPLKAIQAMPGSAKGGDGNSGFYVRGGTSGQNLTMFNDATIYNPSHLLGFFSVFNNTAVQEIKLHKSAIPAEFGGRLSSIIEINSSKRIVDSVSAEGDISLLAASANVQTPITSNWSVSTSARKTFMNYTVWPQLSSLGLDARTFNNIRYDFFDLNLNSNLRITPKNFLYFSAYTGGDDFAFNARINVSNGMDWRNTASSLTWRSILRDNVILNTTASYSGYHFNFGLQQDNFLAGISSDIKDYNLKSNVSVYLEKHHLKAGIQYIDHKLKPNTPSITSFGLDYEFGTPNTYFTDETSVFASDEFELSDVTGIYAGVRLTHYRQKGPYTMEHEDKTETSYSKNSVVSAFTFLEPSLAVRHLLTDNSSLKLSVSRNVQPLHLISVTAVNFPADFWMPSLSSLPAEKGQQISLGYFRNFGSEYETYVDVYFKKMNGLVEFSGGIMNLIDNLKIENNLLFGSGTAYGAEFFAKKRTGKLTGWIGYTLAKSSRSFDEINKGESFPAKYDRRHDLSLISAYDLNQRWSFSGSFTYATGSAYTSPVSRYLISGNVVNEYGPFNGSRMPAYHRMDFSATYKSKPRKYFRSELSLSVYNVYNKQNPIYVYFQAEGDLKEKRVSVSSKSVTILPVLPSINYRIFFKGNK